MELREAGPASPGQRLLWAFERRHGESGALSTPIIAGLDPGIDKAALERALEVLVERHESLRTRLAWRPPKLLRFVSDDWRPNLRSIRVAATDEPEAALNAAIREEISQGLRSTDWPLRPVLFESDAGILVLCLHLNHVATDSVSNRVIIEDLATCHRRACGDESATLDPVAWQYSDWVDWQMESLVGRKGRRHIEYWTAKLEGARPPALPSAGGSAPKRITAYEFCILEGEISAAMADASRQTRSTLFCVVLAIFYLTLYQVTKQRDLTVTSILSERIRKEVLRTVGYMVTNVALRTIVQESQSFGSLVTECRNTLFAAVQHQTMPLHMVPMSRGALNDGFNNVVIQMMGESRTELPEPFRPWDIGANFGGGRTFDLEFVVQPAVDSIMVSALYSTQRYEADTVRQLIRSFTTIAKVALADIDADVDRIVALRGADDWPARATD